MDYFTNLLVSVENRIDQAIGTSENSAAEKDDKQEGVLTGVLSSWGIAIENDLDVSYLSLGITGNTSADENILADDGKIEEINNGTLVESTQANDIMESIQPQVLSDIVEECVCEETQLIAETEITHPPMLSPVVVTQTHDSAAEPVLENFDSSNCDPEYTRIMNICVEKTSKLEAMFDENVKLNSNLKRVSQQLRDRERQNVDINTELNLSRDQNLLLKERVSALQLENEKNKKIIIASNEKLHQIESNLVDFNRMKNTLPSLQRDFDELKIMNISLEKTCSSLKQELTLCEAAKIDFSLKLNQASTVQNQNNSVFQNFQELQANYVKLNADFLQKESILEQTIRDLRSKCALLESQHQDLLLAVPQATQPLLRQLETMSASIKTKSNAWEETEKLLRNRLQDLEMDLSEQKAKYNYLNESNLKLNSELISCSTSLKLLRSSYDTSQKELELANITLQNLKNNEADLNLRIKSFIVESEKHAVSEDQLVKIQNELDKVVLDLRRETTAKNLLESQIIELKQLSSTHKMTESMAVLPASSRNSSFTRDSLVLTSIAESLQKQSESSLQLKIKQKDSEIALLRETIAGLEVTRNSLSDQLVALTAVNFQLNNEVKKASLVEHQMRELSTRYEAAIDVIAEKTQVIQDLQLDLKDVQEVFKEQIQNLLATK